MFCGTAGSPTHAPPSVIGGVITALHHDPEFAAEFRARVIAPKLEVSRAVFERARDRGEIAADLDLDLIAPALAGIVLHRSFVLGEPARRRRRRARHRPDHPARPPPPHPDRPNPPTHQNDRTSHDRRTATVEPP